MKKLALAAVVGLLPFSAHAAVCGYAYCPDSAGAGGSSAWGSLTGVPAPVTAVQNGTGLTMAEISATTSVYGARVLAGSTTISASTALIFNKQTNTSSALGITSQSPNGTEARVFADSLCAGFNRNGSALTQFSICALGAAIGTTSSGLTGAASLTVVGTVSATGLSTGSAIGEGVISSTTGTSYTINLNNASVFRLNLDQSPTINATGWGGAGYCRSATLILKQGGAGTNIATWNIPGLKWMNATTPTLSTTVGYEDWVNLTSCDQGTSVVGGLGYAAVR